MSTLRVLDKDGNWVDIPTIVGPVGPVGPTGNTGPGVSSGGSTGQILRKKSEDDFDTEWITPTDMDLYYTKEEADDLINSKISTTFKYKGTKSSYAEIEAVTNPAVGDVWNDASTDHNYVWNGSTWDKLAGTVDMSNYYTKDEAEDMVDNKINNIPVNDLLHYKGHVDTVEDLPSLGQITAAYTAPNLSLSSWYTAMTNGTAEEFEYLKSKYADGLQLEYFVGVKHGSYPTLRFVGSNYPEIFDGIYIDGGSYTFPGVLMIHVNASSDKPAYVRSMGDLSAKYTGITYDDGTGGAYSSATITRPFWYTLYSSAYSKGAVGNLPSPLKFKVPTMDSYWYCDDWRGTSSQKAFAKPASITIPVESSYTYIEGMWLCKFNKETKAFAFVTTESLAEKNDLYSVGNLRTLYRCSAKPSWEKWSDFKEFQVTEMTEEDYLELSDKNIFDMYIIDRMAEVTETTNLLLNSITGDVDLVEANISEEEALAITDEIIGGVSDE